MTKLFSPSWAATCCQSSDTTSTNARMQAILNDSNTM
jgi:hypothetical protein